jgi:hypothetical protein
MMLLSEERGNVVRWEPERPIKQVEVGQNWHWGRHESGEVPNAGKEWN